MGQSSFARRRVIDAPLSPEIVLIHIQGQLVQQQLGVTRRRAADAARQRHEVPSCRRPFRFWYQRFLANIRRRPRCPVGSLDRRDLNVQQRNFVKAEAANLKMRGRKLSTGHTTLHSNDGK